VINARKYRFYKRVLNCDEGASESKETADDIEETPQSELDEMEWSYKSFWSVKDLEKPFHRA
jgi:hypothetical protein